MRLGVALLVLSALVALGCSSEPARSAPPPTREPTPQVEPDPVPPLAEPPPLPAAREITILADDEVRLVGDLRPGAAPDAPLVVLVHQLGSSRSEWEPLLRRLAMEPGLATFALDMRGHGASTQGPAGPIGHRTFTTADWERVAADVRTVLGHLREEEGLQPRRVAVVGSSIGSSAAIVAAAADPSVHVVVALSPGRAYRGVDAITPATALGDRPLLVVAAREEAPSAETAADLARIAPHGEARLVEGSAHGVRMFEEAPESLTHVEDFLRRELGAASPSGPP